MNTTDTYRATCECCGSSSTPIYWHHGLRCALCRTCRDETPIPFQLVRMRQIQRGQIARAVTRTLLASAS